MSEQSRKEQMKKVPQIKIEDKLKSKRYSKSNGYSMKKGKWRNAA